MPTAPIEAWHRSGVVTLSVGQAIVVPAFSGKLFIATAALLRLTALTSGGMTISFGTNASDYDNLMWDKAITFPDGTGMYELVLGTQSYSNVVLDNGNRWAVIDVGTNPIRANISAAPTGGQGEFMIRGFFL